VSVAEAMQIDSMEPFLAQLRQRLSSHLRLVCHVAWVAIRY